MIARNDCPEKTGQKGLPRKALPEKFDREGLVCIRVGKPIKSVFVFFHFECPKPLLAATPWSKARKKQRRRVRWTNRK